MAVNFDLDQEIVKFFEAKGRNYTEVTVMAWAEVLASFQPDKILNAFNQLKRTSDSFVDVGKIVEIIEGGKSKKAELAWERCLASARKDGRLSIFARDARVLNSLGGMEKLCMASNQDLHWLKKDFINAYSDYGDSDGQGMICFGLKSEILPDGQLEMGLLNG